MLARNRLYYSEENQRENDKVMQVALGHLLSNKALEATTAMSESWENLGLNTGSNGDPGIVLTEELDKEIDGFREAFQIEKICS